MAVSPQKWNAVLYFSKKDVNDVNQNTAGRVRTAISFLFIWVGSGLVGRGTELWGGKEWVERRGDG